MRLLITIPCMDQFEIARCSLAQWDWMTSAEAHFLLLDNGSACDWPRWLETAHLKAPKRWHYLRNDSNVGMVCAAQQAYEWALERDYTHLALTHNDVWVFQQDWDQRLLELYDDWSRISARLGGVGFFGSKGCNRDGLRLQTFGNVLDSGHGRRMTSAWEPAVIFDGFFQCYAMELLRQLAHECRICQSSGNVHFVRADDSPFLSYGKEFDAPCPACGGTGSQRGGFDQRYQWMHIYDYDFSLESIAAGWKNAVLNVPCHHLSGLTANNAAARTSGQDIMEANIKRFHEKWDSRLGVTVNADWTYTWGQR